MAKAQAKKVSNAPIAHAVGRRKRAVARVWLRKGSGKIIVNGRSLETYFTVPAALLEAQQAFGVAKVAEGMDANINLQGGGYTSQSQAVNLGIARALVAFDGELKPEMRKNGYLTVDARIKERKKYGQRGARRKFQFTKR